MSTIQSNPNNNNNNNNNNPYEISTADSDSGLSSVSASDRLEGVNSSANPPLLHKYENTYHSLIQICFSYTVAGLGLVMAGLLLDVVQHWQVYKEIDELFILVPPLLGLKGNLEMTLAARLSTLANKEGVSNFKAYLRIVAYNLALVQAQATVVAILASVLATLLGCVLSRGVFNWPGVPLLFVSAVFAACTAGALLGVGMGTVVYICGRCHINPDNVAAPVAAALGDIVTLGILSVVTSLLYDMLYTIVWLGPIILLISVLLAVVWLYIATREPTTSVIVYSGWTPIVTAMSISSVGGFVLDTVVTGLPGIAVYSPVINGTGGNLAAIQACRISTTLHTRGVPGDVVRDPDAAYEGIKNTFWGANVNARTARWLVLLSVLGSCVFLLIIHGLNAGHTSLSPIFISSYLLCSIAQVSLLMIATNWLVHLFWRNGYDPDNHAIPYITALGDVLGTGILSAAFQVLWLIGDRDQDVAE